MILVLGLLFKSFSLYPKKTSIILFENQLKFLPKSDDNYIERGSKSCVMGRHVRNQSHPPGRSHGNLVKVALKKKGAGQRRHHRPRQIVL